MGSAPIKEEAVKTDDATNTPTPQSVGVGVSTRRASYVTVSQGTV